MKRKKYQNLKFLKYIHKELFAQNLNRQLINPTDSKGPGRVL